MSTSRWLFLSCVVGSFAVSSASGQAGTRVLIDQAFDNVATTRVAAYPPGAGVRFRELLPGFSGWAGGGQIQLTQAPAFGVNGSGGIYAEILKEGTFYQFSFQKLALPMLRPGRVIREPLRSLRLSLDAKLPPGKEVTVYLAVDVPKDVLPESPWSKRLVLGTLRGTDAYQSHVFAGTEIAEETLDTFINFIRDMQLNGMQDVVCSLVFHLDAGGWSAGEGVLIDNVKLTVEGS